MCIFRTVKADPKLTALDVTKEVNARNEAKISERAERKIFVWAYLEARSPANKPWISKKN